MSDDLVTPIPGGEAVWYTRETLTPRRERTMQVSLMPLRSLVENIQDPTYPISKEEAAQVLAVNEVAVAVFLKSWSLDAPVPADADEVLDIESRELYDSLLATAAKILATTFEDGFSVDAVEDENSPTVGLGD